MLKKVLIGFGILAMSVLAYLNFGSLIYSYEELKYVKQSIVDEDFSQSFKIVGSTFNEEDYEVQKIGDTGMSLVQFSAISAEVKTDEEDEKNKFQYVEVFEGIEFALYNISSDLNFNEVNKVVAIDGDDVKHEMNILADWMYDELNAFAFMINAKEVPYIKSVEFLNYKVIKEADEEAGTELEFEEKEIYSIDLEHNDVSFSAEETEIWKDYIVKYNKFDYNYRKEGKYDNDEYNELITELKEIIEETSFCQKDYSTVIAGITSFKVKVILLLIGIGIVDTVLILFFIIRAKKNTPRVNTYQNAQRLDRKAVMEERQAKRIEKQNAIDVEETQEQEEKEVKEIQEVEGNTSEENRDSE